MGISVTFTFSMIYSHFTFSMKLWVSKFYVLGLVINMLKFQFVVYYCMDTHFPLIAKLAVLFIVEIN